MSLCTFLSDETAAVTVDWVVLTAAAVGFGLASAAAVSTGVVSLGSDIETSLSGATVASWGAEDQGILTGVGTPGCDWHCLFAQFHEAENGPYDPAEWGPDINVHANERVAEFERYTTEFLRGTLTQYDGITEQNTPQPYYNYYMAEAQINRNIIAQRGG